MVHSLIQVTEFQGFQLGLNDNFRIGANNFTYYCWPDSPSLSEGSGVITRSC